jgi:hypothetical protein
MRDRACLACGKKNSYGHHIKSFGSSGPCHEMNLAPVCHEHHQLWHEKGSVYMADFFPCVKQFLIDHKWELIEYGDGSYKWKNFRIEKMIRDKSVLIESEEIGYN